MDTHPTVHCLDWMPWIAFWKTKILRQNHDDPSAWKKDNNGEWHDCTSEYHWGTSLEERNHIWCRGGIAEGHHKRSDLQISRPIEASCHSKSQQGLEKPSPHTSRLKQGFRPRIAMSERQDTYLSTFARCHWVSKLFSFLNIAAPRLLT